MDSPSHENPKFDSARRRFLNVWTAVGAILLTGVVIYLLNILSGPVGILIWTVIIVFCLRSPVNWLEKKGVNRAIGTACAYVLMFVVIGLVGMLMFSPVFGVGSQFTDLATNIPVYAQQLVDWGNNAYSQYAYIFENETIRQWLTDVQSSMLEWASSFAKDSASGVVAVGSTLVNGVVIIGFALVVAFWILMELPALGRECKRLISPAHQEDARMLHAAFTRVMGGYIKGTLLQCALIGVVCGALFALVGIPNAAALGGITGILNIIPIVGPWLGGAAAALVGIFTSPWAALLSLAGTIAIQQVVYTFISPQIMSDSVDIHPVLNLIALMAGSAIGGAMSGFVGSLVGMLASIPAVAVAKAVFVYYFEKHTGRRIVAPDGVFFKGTSAQSDDFDPVADATSPNAYGGVKVLRARKAVRKVARADAQDASRDTTTESAPGASLDTAQEVTLDNERK